MNQVIAKKLEELEKTKHDFKNIDPEAGSILSTLIQAANFKGILEAGTSNGYSTIWLAEAVSKTGGHVTTMEIDPEKIRLAEQNFQDAGVAEFITIKAGDAWETIKELNQQFDLVFIDAAQENLEMFRLIDSKLLKPKGILAMDNVISHKEENREVIEAIENSENYQSVTLPFGGGLLLALKLA